MAGRGPGKAPEFTEEEIRQAFIAFDRDENGFVGAGEIRFVYSQLGEEITDEEVQSFCTAPCWDRTGTPLPKSSRPACFRGPLIEKKNVTCVLCVCATRLML